jgi:hypothetical protein
MEGLAERIQTLKVGVITQVVAGSRQQGPDMSLAFVRNDGSAGCGLGDPDQHFLKLDRAG